MRIDAERIGVFHTVAVGTPNSAVQKSNLVVPAVVPLKSPTSTHVIAGGLVPPDGLPSAPSVSKPTR